jgi:altronate hydrolase
MDCRRYLRIKPEDNVAVVADTLNKSDHILLDGIDIAAVDNIPAGHKISLCHIPEGAEILKYGSPIGYASRDISAGEHVHTHNMKSSLNGILEYEYRLTKPPEGIRTALSRTFMGYERKDGGVGVRNEIWILNTVGCVNKTAELLAREANIRFSGRTEGIFTFPHPYGCSQLGDDQRNTQKILAALVRHPNAAGVLVLGLGCENNNIEEFKKILGEYDPDRVMFLSTQEVEDEIEEGLKLIGRLCDFAGSFKRKEIPLSRLIVGLKCGGSDSFSGITANPLTGAFSDLLIQNGGTAVLTEIPEMFGAETVLMNRCRDQSVFSDFLDLVNNFREYYSKNGCAIYENPSPGNREGGISTLEEKSMGCVQKGGNSMVVEILKYGDSVRKPGLNILGAPGNDIVSSTALAAAGAQIILFTTGRGTPLGAPVPTIKISSNSALYSRKQRWIDFDAGRLLDGSGIDILAGELLNLVVDTASGHVRTKNEINGYREIAVFKNGVTL